MWDNIVSYFGPNIASFNEIKGFFDPIVISVVSSFERSLIDEGDHAMDKSRLVTFFNKNI